MGWDFYEDSGPSQTTPMPPRHVVMTSAGRSPVDMGVRPVGMNAALPKMKWTVLCDDDVGWVGRCIGFLKREVKSREDGFIIGKIEARADSPLEETHSRSLKGSPLGIWYLVIPSPVGES